MLKAEFVALNKRQAETGKKPRTIRATPPLAHTPTRFAHHQRNANCTLSPTTSPASKMVKSRKNTSRNSPISSTRLQSAKSAISAASKISTKYWRFTNTCGKTPRTALRNRRHGDVKVNSLAQQHELWLHLPRAPRGRLPTNSCRRKPRTIAEAGLTCKSAGDGRA